jgi:hypothetical protein
MTVVARVTGRNVCSAFAEAMRIYGVPEEVLSDNGKQFIGRFGKPRPAEVLSERICRENGITQRLTKPRSPTTTGKIERLHQTLQLELLNVHEPFTSIEDAQAAVDARRAGYNADRPHQSLGMALPTARFVPATGQVLPLRVPADLAPPRSARTTTAAMAGPASAGPPAAQHPCHQRWITAGRTPRHRAPGRPPRPPPGQRYHRPHGRLPGPAGARRRLRGARAAATTPPRLPGQLTVQRRVSVRGAIMIGGQRIQIGLPHAGKTAEVIIETDTYQISVEDGITVTAPRKTSRDIRRHKASNYQWVPDMATFAVTLVHGSSWDTSRPIRQQQAWDQHASFMDGLVDDGFIIIGGPLGDGGQTLHLVQAESQDQIKARLAEDPWAARRRGAGYSVRELGW